MDINIKSKFNVGDKVKSKYYNLEGTVTSIRTVVSYTAAWSDNTYGTIFEDHLETVKLVTPKFKVGDLVVLKNTEKMAGREFGEIICHKDTMWGIMLTPAIYRYIYNESDMLPYTPTSPHYFQD